MKHFYDICKRKNQRLRIDKETLKDIERLENLKKKIIPFKEYGDYLYQKFLRMIEKAIEEGNNLKEHY